MQVAAAMQGLKSVEKKKQRYQKLPGEVLRHISRITIWLIPLVAALLFFYFSERVEEEIVLATSRIELLEGRFAFAANLLARLENSDRLRDEAATGLAIAAILSGTPDYPMQPSSVDSRTLEDYSITLLMLKELRAGNSSTLLQLAVLAEGGGIPEAALFKAAALLENGRLAEALEYLNTVPDILRGSHLAQLLAETIRLRQAGAATIVRDRYGELIGTVNSERELVLAENVPPESITSGIALEIVEQAGSDESVRVGIDLELSRLALAALDSYRGTIVLLDPHSGEILAAVSDAGTISRSGANSTPAFDQHLEPASIMKIITTTAAKRAGLDPDKALFSMFCNGAARYDGAILYCTTRHGSGNGLSASMAASCNVVFANLGVSLGWERMMGELNIYGFNSGLGNPFDFGKVLVSAGDDRSLADLSIGLGNTDITPLHAALIAALLANDGVMPEPVFVSSRGSYLGYRLEPSRKQAGKRVINKEWLPEIVDAMRAVARPGGTAALVAPVDYPVAMKTGTGSSNAGYHINYIGFGPLPKPTIAFCIRITNERTSARARKAGYQVTQRLLAGLRSTYVKFGLQ